MSIARRSDGEPHDHHYVPRGFLRQWCGADKQLAHIYRDHGRIRCRRIGPKGVASKHDLYNLRDIGISPAVFLTLFTLEAKFGVKLDERNFEKTLMQEIDTRGIAAHRKFLQDSKAASNSDTLYDFLRFIYILGARNPGYLETLQVQVIGDLEKLLRDRGLGNSPLLDVDDLRRDLNEDEFKRRHDGLACFIYVLDTDKLAFVTTDIPFVAMPDEIAPIHFVPLSPRHCLIMSKNVDLIYKIRAHVNEHLSGFVNLAMMMKANNVFALDCREKDAAERYLGTLKSKTEEANRALREAFEKAIS
jgi:Protein of unknown function (DUF4238)